jgi:hypothetical protein
MVSKDSNILCCIVILLSVEGKIVAEQRVTGLELLAGERMETETRINLAASFMNGGGFLSI